MVRPRSSHKACALNIDANLEKRAFLFGGQSVTARPVRGTQYLLATVPRWPIQYTWRLLSFYLGCPPPLGLGLWRAVAHTGFVTRLSDDFLNHYLCRCGASRKVRYLGSIDAQGWCAIYWHNAMTASVAMAAPINSTRAGQTLTDLETIAPFSIVTTASRGGGSTPPPGHRHRGDIVRR